MKAVVFHDVGDIRYEEVPDPRIEDSKDAVVRIIASAICGTDLHMIRGTLPGMKPGTVLGHEGVGVIEELGPDVRNFNIGDRVIIPSTISCGYCSYCRQGYTSQCDNANPNGPLAGTAFFGGPAQTGPINGLQAERARIPLASSTLVLAPEGLTDDEAVLLSDIFPTGYFGARLAEIGPGETVAVFGCGPVGQFAIASAKLMDAGLVFAIDTIPSRLEMARAQGAIAIDYNQEDPVQTIHRLTGAIGVDRAIDAVGVDASQPNRGPAAEQFRKMEQQFQQELRQIAPQTHPQGDNWHPGDAPSIVSSWAVEALAKGGTLSIIGVYPATDRFFPIGKAMNKNLTINMGNCNHRKYIPMLIDLIMTGVIDPTEVLTQHESFDTAIEAYKAFDKREPGWVKVKLAPAEVTG